jgi:hypothetical protein
MGLIERGTFKLVKLADASDKNVIPTKFVLSIKHIDVTEKFKARFCLGGHRDFMKKVDGAHGNSIVALVFSSNSGCRRCPRIRCVIY